MLQYWRVILLAVIVFGSVLAIGMKAFPYGRNGVEIVYFSEDSPARNVLEQGMIITVLNGQAIKNVDEWNARVPDLKGNITLVANGVIHKLDVNETLGIDVTNIERTNLEFGLDLRGGTRIILKPKENATKDTIDQVISTLQTRANIYGLKEMNFFPVRGSSGEYYVQIEVAGVKRDVVDDLLSTEGKFEAKISKPVKISDDRGEIQLGQEIFDAQLVTNQTIRIQGEDYSPGDSFTLKEIEIEYLNSSETRMNFVAKVYDGDDVELVYTDPQRSGVVPIQGGYRFFFGVLVSPDGAQRFADVTSGVASFLDIQSGERYLESEIFIYLDNELVDSLRISSDLGGRIVLTPQISGSRQEMEDAVAEKLRLQTILRSGALPTGLETVSVSIVSPALGSGFFTSTTNAALLAAIVVVLIIFIRYRKASIAFPMILIGLSEILIILGIAAINDALVWLVILIINFLIIATAWWKKHDIDIYAWVGALLIPLIGLTIGWTIDLPAIAGIIAAIGIGMDHMIIIADETLRKSGEEKIYSIKDRVKRAFFIIFGAAATTMAAMIPLMSIGIGFVRGFAITTMVGVLIGVLVTRPAYARILERLTEE
jgi:preprotein translocase subunit SecD